MPSLSLWACGYVRQVLAQRHMLSQVAEENLRLGGTRGLAQSLFVKLTASLELELDWASSGGRTGGQKPSAPQGGEMKGPLEWSSQVMHQLRPKGDYWGEIGIPPY